MHNKSVGLCFTATSSPPIEPFPIWPHTKIFHPTSKHSLHKKRTHPIKSENSHPTCPFSHILQIDGIYPQLRANEVIVQHPKQEPGNLEPHDGDAHQTDFFQTRKHPRIVVGVNAASHKRFINRSGYRIRIAHGISTHACVRRFLRCRRGRIGAISGENRGLLSGKVREVGFHIDRAQEELSRATSDVSVCIPSPVETPQAVG